MTDNARDSQGLNHITYNENSESGKAEKSRIIKDFAKESYAYNLKNHKDVYLRFTRFVDENGKPKLPSDDDSKKEISAKENEKIEVDKKNALAKKEAAKHVNEEEDDIQKAIRESTRLENAKNTAMQKEEEKSQKSSRSFNE